MERRMMRYRASAHYIWKSTDKIGEGGYGTVFKGFHKLTGSTVAIKALAEKQLSPAHVDQHMKELAFLERLEHKNIVRLLGVEDEVVSEDSPRHDDSLGKVLIMEYCNGGSLQALINRPENALGLSDTDLLVVVADVVAGLRYLRGSDRKVLHRDLKPGNILRTLSPNGDIVYKLCDFGAAKELDDEETFKSYVGTEEYLHPEIYKKCFQGDGNSNFHPSCDLWSLGVTLYQLGTGQLPFQPLGGPRQNRRSMLEMTMVKPKGAISGRQEPSADNTARYVWSEKLPVSSALSAGLRRELEPLLARLLEVSAESRMSYEDLFDMVDRLLAKRPLHILHVPAAAALTSYQGPRLQDALKQALPDLPSMEDLTLLWHGSFLGLSDSVAAVPTAFDDPILVFPTALFQISKTPPPESLVLPAPGNFNAAGDVDWALGVMGLGQRAAGRVEALANALRALSDGRRALRLRSQERLAGLGAEGAGWDAAWQAAQARWAVLLPDSEGASETLRRKRATATTINGLLLDWRRDLNRAKETNARLAALPTPPAALDQG